MTDLFKIVDGESVPLSQEEVTEYMARQTTHTSAAPERLRQTIVDQTEAQLDAFAATRGYDGILSACTYATSTVPKFAAEGAYCVMLRDQTWAALYQMLAEVEAGSRPIPSGFDEIAGELPTATAEWPT